MVKSTDSVLYSDKYDGLEYAIVELDGVKSHRYSKNIGGDTYDYYKSFFFEGVCNGQYVTRGARRADALIYAKSAFSRVK